MPPVSHAPADYSCPFCRLQGDESDDRNRATDVVAVTERAYARIAPRWAGGSAGDPARPRAQRANSTSPFAMSARTTRRDTTSPGATPSGAGADAVTAGSAI